MPRGSTRGRHYGVVAERLWFDEDPQLGDADPGLGLFDWIEGTEGACGLASAAARLASLERATLEWWFFHPSHSVLTLLATTPDSRVTELRFVGSRYLDLPVRTHRARLRLASPAERHQLDGQLPPSELATAGPEEALIIEGDEGDYSLRAALVAIRARSAPDYSFLRRLSKPLRSSRRPRELSGTDSG